MKDIIFGMFIGAASSCVGFYFAAQEVAERHQKELDILVENTCETREIPFRGTYEICCNCRKDRQTEIILKD